MQKKGNKYGTHRVIEPQGLLTQAAKKIDNTMECWSNEILCDVSALNIDSASFTQIYEACGKDLGKTEQMILAIVNERGKMQNPVTGSGGMFIGTVKEIGEDLQGKIDLKVGDKIASLVSLSLTPLKINKIKAIHPEIDRVDVEAQAILFESGLYAKLPDDMSEELALAALEATLLDWRDGTAVPVSAMLSAPPEELRRRAEALAEALSPLHPCTAVETQGEVGGGARPGESLPAWAAALEPAEALEAHLRAWRVPILGRIHRGKLLLDVRTLLPGDEAEIAAALAAWREERA